MRKVILFIAMSLDGYIADRRGSVNWLHGHGSDEENTDTYSDFVKDMDTVVMGWNTYHQVATDLLYLCDTCNFRLRHSSVWGAFQ